MRECLDTCCIAFAYTMSPFVRVPPSSTSCLPIASVSAFPGSSHNLACKVKKMFKWKFQFSLNSFNLYKNLILGQKYKYNKKSELYWTWMFCPYLPKLFRVDYCGRSKLCPVNHFICTCKCLSTTPAKNHANCDSSVKSLHIFIFDILFELP